MKRFFPRRKRHRPADPLQKRIAVAVVMALALILIPSGSANAAPADLDWKTFVTGLDPAAGLSSWAIDKVKNECTQPGMEADVYGSGFDGMATHASPGDGSYFGQYGTAGTYWNWIPGGCTDFTTPIGNQVANLIFNFAKTVDTVTISVYQVAASGSITNWLKDAADSLITHIGRALQVGYLTLVVMLGALALIWWGLFKRRATRVTEGTIWMVCAAAAFMLLINRPELFTTAGSSVTDATQKVVDAALSPVDTPTMTGGKSRPVSQAVINGQGGKLSYQAQTVCIPSGEGGNPQYSGSWTPVQKNANSMWSVLICKPWLQGEFGTANPNQRIVQGNADKLIHAQAFNLNEVRKPGGVTDAASQTKGKQYLQVLDRVHKEHGNVALFTGKQFSQRIGIAFAALFAAVVAGILILLLSLALIIFKLGFLLLLITGPVFLLIGVHPGWGRVIAVRWVELLLSSLLKQALVAGLLALLLFLYALIMGTGGLTWVMQIVLIALVSFAAFFYRKPFQHLFAAVGTDSIGSRILSNATTGSNVFKTGTAPLAAPQRVNKWTLRKAQPLTDAAGATGHPAGMAVALGSRMATGNATDDDVSGRTAGRISAVANQKGDGSGPSTGTRPTAGNRRGTNAPPLNLPRPGEGHTNGPNGAGGPGTTPRGGVRPGGGPTTVGTRPGASSGNAPVTTGAGWGPRSGEAPPMWKPSSPSGTPSRNAPTPSTPPAPTSSGSGSGPRSGAGGWFGSSWRRSGAAGAGPSGPNGPKPPNDGGGGGPRRTGGGGWFGGGSKRDGGTHDPAPPPPRRTERRDTSSGPAPWRKRESAPPLWAKPSKPPAPDIPFWTRPDK